jgi:hypothetical protein
MRHGEPSDNILTQWLWGRLPRNFYISGRLEDNFVSSEGRADSWPIMSVF